MPILPQTALFVILQCWSIVLQLVSQYWYERQLSRYHDHWLVQLHQVTDFGPLEQACAGFHANNGRGTPLIHSPRRLVRALLVKYRNYQACRVETRLSSPGWHKRRAPISHLQGIQHQMTLFTHGGDVAAHGGKIGGAG